jgi:monoamine oxidase
LKLGLQASERFWEREQIYGGISWTAQDITQIWYPSHGIHRKKGVLLAAYIYGGPRAIASPICPPRRLELAIRQGRRCTRTIAATSRRRQRGVHRMNHMLRLRGRMDRVVPEMVPRFKRPSVVTT